WNFDPTPGTNPADDGALPGGGNGSCSNHVCDDLIPLLGITNADCGVAGAGDAACAVVNTGSTTSPWAFKDKSGNTSFATAEFYEGGINLSLLPAGIASECFSSFSVETRSSATPDAVLKDFVLGNFGSCTATLSTTPSNTTNPVTPGTAVHDTATVTGSRATINPTGNVTFFLCSFGTDITQTCDDSDTAHHGDQVGL